MTTPRDRWLAYFNGCTPDRIPTDYWATSEVTDRLLKDLNCGDREQLLRKLHIDAPRGVRPKHRYGNKHRNDRDANIWGIRKQSIDYGSGSYNETAENPLASMTTINELKNYPWPSADDFDYDVVTKTLSHDDGYRAITACGYEPFLLYCDMRGLQMAYEDLIINPEFVEYALEIIFEVHYEINRRTFEAGRGKIDLTYIAEDLGSQHGPLFSVDTYRRFLLTNQKKMADLARKYNLRILYHTDGAASAFLPDLIDVVGIDILNPIQWRCPGMEREVLMKQWGSKVIFHSSIDNQQTLPFGTVADVRKEVIESREIFRDGRWICGPCHNLQPVTPTENIIALYETIYEIGS